MSAPLLSFETLDGNDRLIIDFVNGDSLPAAGIEFLAGFNQEQLIFRNASTATGQFTPTDSVEGILTVNGKRIIVNGLVRIDVSGFEGFTDVKTNSRDFYIRSPGDGSVQLLDDGTEIILLAETSEHY